MAGLAGLAVVVLFAAVLLVPRFLRACRVRGTTAPARPRSEATRPYAYDNGLVVGEEDS